jgi:hypothetical protein
LPDTPAHAPPKPSFQGTLRSNVALVLLAFNLTVMPHKMWALWVMGGWGLGLLMHASRIFRVVWFLGPQWERQQVERRLGRPL